MAKLVLKFNQTVLKEFSIGSLDKVTIGRTPDNHLQVDNLAVSSHHAMIRLEEGGYVIEDMGSTNGTFINNHRVTRQALKDGDEILVGKHIVVFSDRWEEEETGEHATVPAPTLPKMDSTVVFDARQARDLLGGAAAVAGAPAPAGRARIGNLVVMDGKTDHSRYSLSGKLSVIGKSEMATVKLKSWFAPKVAAVIHRRENKYFVAASEKSVKVLVNGEAVTGQRQLQDGDMIEVAGVKVAFGWQDDE